MTAGASVVEWIRGQAARRPEAEALFAPERRPLTYRSLVEQIDAAAVALASAGVRRGDRVAVVLPNGPEMATAFLAVSATATCAPLNSSYTSQEFEFYLSYLKPRLLIAQAGSASPAAAVAAALGMRVIELLPQPGEPAGVFALNGTGGRAKAPHAARAGDVALVLHTSGTTSRPKIVPLTHANLAASAGNIAAALQLSPQDRCLNFMPLFHVHGLIGAVLASLTAGAGVICAPGLDPDLVMEWLGALAPTWYTAVPTMHQAILEAAGRNPDLAGRVRLRFIRSCSSALSPQVGQRLEAVFHAPVIEAYGMTEASHQIACNPLPPRPHKFGSVGLPTGDEVTILDEGGEPLLPNAQGEIAIRGANVMGGYVDNPAANASAFSSGWLRTGDRGYRDEDGYIFIQARLKEMINRGGEKISPREIDEALLQHPAVLQAVAFAVPHPTLGQDVAAAVVLRARQAASAAELRSFVAGRLAAFKVPRWIVFVPEVPKGPTGKVQRIELAGKLEAELQALAADVRRDAPRTPVEARLVATWQEILDLGEIGIHDDFFQLGGDSLRAMQLLARLGDLGPKDLTLADLLKAPTVAELAGLIGAGIKKA